MEGAATPAATTASADQVPKKSFDPEDDNEGQLPLYWPVTESITRDPSEEGPISFHLYANRPTVDYWNMTDYQANDPGIAFPGNLEGKLIPFDNRFVEFYNAWNEIHGVSYGSPTYDAGTSRKSCTVVRNHSIGCDADGSNAVPRSIYVIEDCVTNLAGFAHSFDTKLGIIETKVDRLTPYNHGGKFERKMLIMIFLVVVIVVLVHAIASTA